MTRASRKRTGLTTSNRLIFNTCHSISIEHTITTLHTIVIPMIATFSHVLWSLSNHWEELHLLEISFSGLGFKYMINTFWHNILMLWTLKWTMTSVLKTNTTVSIKLIDKVFCYSINERCHMSYCLATSYKHYYIIHVIHTWKLFVIKFFF